MSNHGTQHDKHDRGRDAQSPAAMPVRGWRDALWRVKTAVSTDALSLIAAGVAFYAFLSLFPTITAILSIYGLVAEPSQVGQQIGQLQGTMPSSAVQLIQSRISALTQSDNSTLGISLVVSVLIALYSASKGTGALITALNVAYDEEESRGFFKLKGFTLLLTFAGIVVMILLLAAISLPTYLGTLGLPTWLNVIIRVIRWVLTLGLMMGMLALIYAWAPSRRRPKLRWATSGAIVAALLWLIVSIAFSFYLGHFGSYNKTYGSAAAIVITLTWFWLSAFFVLIGAEINAELEGQTKRDSTHGASLERGERGAVAADDVRDSP